VFDSILIDDSVQRFDGAAQIGDTPVERVDLVFQMSDSLFVGDYHTQFLTVLTSASAPRI